MKKILIIDDDSLVRHAYALTFEEMGYEVKTVSSGWKGIENLQKNDYDLILLDLNMPGMNGVETLKAIRKTDSHIPVYIVSGFNHSFMEELSSLRNDGVSFELANKPLNKDQLENIVSTVFEDV